MKTIAKITSLILYRVESFFFRILRQVRRIRNGFDASPKSWRAKNLLIRKNLTYVFEARMFCPHAKIRNKNSAHMMAVDKQVICAVADFKDWVEHKVSQCMRSHERMIQVIRLVVSVASVIQDEGVYNKWWRIASKKVFQENDCPDRLEFRMIYIDLLRRQASIAWIRPRNWK